MEKEGRKELRNKRNMVGCAPSQIVETAQIKCDASNGG